MEKVILANRIGNYCSTLHGNVEQVSVELKRISLRFGNWELTNTSGVINNYNSHGVLTKSVYYPDKK
jgi:hypothetical protein